MTTGSDQSIEPFAIVSHQYGQSWWNGSTNGSTGDNWGFVELGKSFSWMSGLKMLHSVGHTWGISPIWCPKKDAGCICAWIFACSALTILLWDIVWYIWFETSAPIIEGCCNLCSELSLGATPISSLGMLWAKVRRGIASILDPGDRAIIFLLDQESVKRSKQWEEQKECTDNERRETVMTNVWNN